jgi:DNA polymerase-3 subunit epsilon/CBS domain-containing protein
MLPPLAHTPLIALPALVLDLETTGLDVRADRIVQVSAIAMQGDCLTEAPVLDSLIDPGIPIPPASTRIHHIQDADVSGAPAFAEVADQLKALFSGHVVIGHNVGFDMAILRHEAARAGIPWHEPEFIDIALLVGALQPSLPDLGLETVAASLGVEITNRHSARGDSLAAAQAWAKLVPLLRDNEIRTLGEVLTLAGRREDLIMRQTEAGWFETPGELIRVAHLPPVGRIDSYVFNRRLADVMRTPPQHVSPQTTLKAAAVAMSELEVGSLLVGVEGAGPQGIITRNDLLRVISQGTPDLKTGHVAEVMSSPVECMHQREMLYRAIARMDRTNISHLCVVDDAGLAVGMVSLRNLLQHRARGAEMLSDALEAADDPPSLAAAYSRVASVAYHLLLEDMQGVDIARMISGELRALTARATQIAMTRMEAGGKGPPPADWCVLVLGSGGRAESLLGADQDNALIHTGSDADDPWFAETGAIMTGLLDAAGVPLCKGGVMVSSAEWRGTTDAWRQRIDGWLLRARPEDLLNVDIFFDLTPVAGTPALAHDLHEEAVRAAARAPAFTNLLAQSVQAFAPRFSMIGRLPMNEGRINLKRDGLLPLVSLARTLALRSGSTVRSTSERLRDSVAAGRISEGDAERLIELHARLLNCLLRQQIDDLQNGIALSGTVVPGQLSRDEQSQLKKGLKHLNTMVGEVMRLVAG